MPVAQVMALLLVVVWPRHGVAAAAKTSAVRKAEEGICGVDQGALAGRCWEGQQARAVEAVY